MGNRAILVVDIDGTTADSSERVRGICERFAGVGSDWWGDQQINEFLSDAGIASDKPMRGARRLSRIAQRMGVDIIFLTGRSERGRRATTLWIWDNLDIEVGLPPHMCLRKGKAVIPLYMRDDDDYRPGFLAKAEVLAREILPLHKGRTLVFLDDDPKCLEAYSVFGVALRSPHCWRALWSGYKEKKAK